MSAQTNKATAVWKGNLAMGDGQMQTRSGAVQSAYTFKTRFEGQEGTNPEEMIAAAHAACFSMAFSHLMSEAGYSVDKVSTEASVILDKVEDGFAITTIELKCDAEVPDISAADFEKIAQDAKTGCPISKALSAVPQITLSARLNGEQAIAA